MKFKVGDKIEMPFYDGIVHKGKILSIEGDYLSTTFGISFFNWHDGHDLGGLVNDNSGWWFQSTVSTHKECIQGMKKTMEQLELF